MSRIKSSCDMFAARGDYMMTEADRLKEFGITRVNKLPPETERERLRRKFHQRLGVKPTKGVEGMYRREMPRECNPDWAELDQFFSQKAKPKIVKDEPAPVRSEIYHANRRRNQFKLAGRGLASFPS